MQQTCPNAGYGFEDKTFSGKESRENETGEKHGEPDEPASQTPGLQDVQQGDKWAVPQSPGHLQDSKSSAQGEKGGCVIYTSPSPRERTSSRMPSSG